MIKEKLTDLDLLLDRISDNILDDEISRAAYNIGIAAVWLEEIINLYNNKENDLICDDKDKYEDLYTCYIESNMISSSTPDQYQYRHNKLCQKLAEFILVPYLIKSKKESDLED